MVPARFVMFYCVAEIRAAWRPGTVRGAGGGDGGGSRGGGGVSPLEPGEKEEEAENPGKVSRWGGSVITVLAFLTAQRWGEGWVRAAVGEGTPGWILFIQTSCSRKGAKSFCVGTKV